MSLILDALRKSEAERQRGQSPGLFAGQPILAAPRRSRLEQYWPLMAASLLVLGAAIAFWATRDNRDPEREQTISSESKQDDSTPENLPDRSVEPTPAAPVPKEIHSDARPTDSSSAAATAPAMAPAMPSQTPLTSAEPAMQKKAAKVAPPESAATQAARAAIQAPIAPAPSATPMPPKPAETAVEQLPPITVLSASERASLPPLKLSMHVWNSEPGSRFAIIDGQRISEGSILGSAVVEEIRRDGVVLNIDGRRILLPRP